MEIKNRLFPYPVLCGDTDDYAETTEFAVEPHTADNAHELLFNYDFILSCNALETLIRKGEAEYVLHIECGSTAFRIALKNTVPHIEYRLPKSRVSGEINLVAMIVARKDITNYYGSELNEDYIGESINFAKGAILAYQNLPPVYVIKKTEKLANNESFFTVVKKASLDPDEILPLSFNLISDKIQIIVDSKTYDAFVHHQHCRSFGMAMLVLPAVTYMITEVHNSRDTYRQYEWYQQLQQFYLSQGKDFLTDVIDRDENPVIIAQEMLQNPVSMAYRDLFTLEG